MLLRDAVRATVPALRARAAETERRRCVPAESLTELAATGLLRAFTPTRYGGGELDFATTFDALVEVARGCSATGWVASLMVVHHYLLARFDPRAQDEVWAEGPDVLVASGVAPSGEAVRVDGGLRVSGRWSYSSGVDHATWAILNAHLREGGIPTSYFVLVPATDYEIDDDWHVGGLRGSGSKAVKLADVFVPPHRFETGLAINAGKTSGLGANSALYRASFPALFPLIFTPAAVGTAHAMIEHFREFISARRAAYTGAAYKDKVGSWLRLADASAGADAARLLLDRDLVALQHEATAGATVVATTERARYDVAYIVELCRRAVDGLYAGSGGRALYDASPLGRCFRDMHAITQHAATGLDDAAERYGKFLLDAR